MEIHVFQKYKYIIIILFIFTFCCLCVCVCQIYEVAYTDQKRVWDPLKPGVANDSEVPDVGTWNWTVVLYKGNSCS